MKKIQNPVFQINTIGPSGDDSNEFLIGAIDGKAAIELGEHIMKETESGFCFDGDVSIEGKIDLGSSTELATTKDLEGKQDKIDSSNELSSDLVDDTGKAHLFVSSAEKETWNGKSTVSANPSGSDGDDLTRISINGANYKIPSGGGGGQSINLTVPGNMFRAIISHLYNESGIGNASFVSDYLPLNWNNYIVGPEGGFVGYILCLYIVQRDNDNDIIYDAQWAMYPNIDESSEILDGYTNRYHSEAGNIDFYTTGHWSSDGSPTYFYPNFGNGSEIILNSTMEWFESNMRNDKEVEIIWYFGRTLGTPTIEDYIYIPYEVVGGCDATGSAYMPASTFFELLNNCTPISLTELLCGPFISE